MRANFKTTNELPLLFAVGLPHVSLAISLLHDNICPSGQSRIIICFCFNLSIVAVQLSVTARGTKLCAKGNLTL